MQTNAITKHVVAAAATFLEVETQAGMVPVAIYGAVWVPATFTTQLKLVGPGPHTGEVESYKATDDAAVTLVDDVWNTIPEALGRKLSAVGKFRFLFNIAESTGLTAQIAWAPLGGA